MTKDKFVVLCIKTKDGYTNAVFRGDEVEEVKTIQLKRHGNHNGMRFNQDTLKCWKVCDSLDEAVTVESQWTSIVQHDPTVVERIEAFR